MTYLKSLILFGRLQVDIGIKFNLPLEKLSAGGPVNHTDDLFPASAVSYFRSLATAFSAYVLLYVWVSFPLTLNCQILQAGLLQNSRQSRQKLETKGPNTFKY